MNTWCARLCEGVARRMQARHHKYGTCCGPQGPAPKRRSPAASNALAVGCRQHWCTPLTPVHRASPHHAQQYRRLIIPRARAPAHAHLSTASTSEAAREDLLYAVFSGRKPGVYDSYQSCRQQIHRYANGVPVWQAFSSRAEAREWLLAGSGEASQTLGLQQAPRWQQSSAKVKTVVCSTHKWAACTKSTCCHPLCAQSAIDITRYGVADTRVYIQTGMPSTSR